MARSPSRARQLLDAVAGVASDLSLADVLRRIVRSSRDLVAADHATLGIFGPDGEPVEFVHDGLDDTTHRPIHLAVSIYARGVHVGDLHLTRTSGGSEFTEEDRAIVGALATAGGIAIDNARLFEQTRQRELWLRTSNEITGALLASQCPSTALALVTRRARAMAVARFAAIALPRNGAAATVWSGAIGPGAKSIVSQGIPRATGAIDDVLRTSTPRLIDDVTAPPHNWFGDLRRKTGRLGSAVLVPLAVGQYKLGVLIVARQHGKPPFTGADLQMVWTYAEHAALAIEFARAQQARQRIAVLEDRDRIARDLHDLVIQRLFAVGLGLQSLVKLAGPSETADQAARFIVDLDATIREIRRSIFSLQEPSDGPPSLRRDLLLAVGEAAGPLGFAPRIDLAGALDSLVPDDVRPDLLAAVREALSNVARHAEATDVLVEVTVDSGGHWLRLTVSDNGHGVPAALQRHSGLANLHERATRWGGGFDVESALGNGFALRWSVPIGAAPNGPGDAGPRAQVGVP